MRPERTVAGVKTLKIDGRDISAKAEQTILEAAVENSPLYPPLLKNKRGGLLGIMKIRDLLNPLLFPREGGRGMSFNAI
jgi:hypothetical protein